MLVMARISMGATHYGQLLKKHDPNLPRLRFCRGSDGTKANAADRKMDVRPQCYTHHIRDHNAALNILREKDSRNNKKAQLKG